MYQHIQNEFKEELISIQDTYTATKWISFAVFLIPLLLSILYYIFKPISSLPPYLFFSSFLLLIPFFGYKKHKNISRIVLSFSAPFIIIIISIIGKINLIDYNSLHSIHYFDARVLLLSSVIIPISTISILEKGLLFFCILPSLLLLTLYDPIHNFFEVGFYQVGFVDSDYYETVNLYSLLTYAFLLFGILHLKYKNQASETRHFEKSKMLEYYLIKLNSLSNSNQINFGDLDLALKEICLVAQDCLKVNRVIIWSYIEMDDSIEAMIVLNNNEFKKVDEKLYGKDYPYYFKEVKENGMVVANDVYSHVATSEFDIAYLKKLEIKSILDSPFIQHGKFGGVISCENQYEHRSWSIEEIIMLKALGDFLSYTLVAHKLMKYNEELEERISERTGELKSKNDQLSEYAFINSHILGAPVARISGLVNLLDKMNEEDIDNIKSRMTASVEELKDVTRQINHAIEEFGVIKRENIKVDNKSGN